MHRPITGYHQDPQGDWVAELSCGHGQHVRHRPPMTLRPWVTSEEGRAGRRGTPLDCVRCDRGELPDGYQPYKRTAEFTEATIPAGLLSGHALRSGVWGVLRVLYGRLHYVVEAPEPATESATVSATESATERERERGGGAARPTSAPQVLDTDHPIHIPPEVRHHVEACGPVRFVVEFHCRPDES
jgi:tellurite resistance-related uncharacterized protein